MNIIEIVKKRKSCRTFNQVSLDPAEKRELENFMNENAMLPGGEVINLRIIEKNGENKKMKLNYGMIQWHNTYILGKSKSTSDSRVNYGYLMEKVVLKATEMDISTCWIGYFDPAYFNEIDIENGFEIPSIVIIGYPQDKQSPGDKFTRFSVNASKRQRWEKLFFSYKLKTPITPELVNKYAESLEMVRLGPSSGNTQPWRIFFDDTFNEFHFFKKPINKGYEEKGLHDIDMGIALSHFELTSMHNGLSGSLIKYAKERVSSFDDLQYIMTWKCK